MENGPSPPEAAGSAEPPDDSGDGDGPHFTQTDPSGRFGRFDNVLGRGAFKVVYKAFDTQEGTEVAWNQVRVSEVMSAKDAENKEERDRLFAEIRVLKALKHKNIMSFYDSWYDPKTYTVNFITELFTSGTLRQYRKRHKHIDEEVVKRWAYQILCGLVYLHGHSPPIIHRDLKCDNIFINGSDGVVKIGDLGLATMLRSRTAPQSVLGTPEFMAPELYEEEYDDRVDVYSFGMCLLELSTMEYPYAECKNAAQIYRKVSLGVRPAGLQKVVSQELAEFIKVCISPRESRPRARQLLKHPYFDSIRRDKALASSRSDAALAASGAGSEYGSLTSGPVSRTASSLADMVAAAGGLLSTRSERESSGRESGGGGPPTAVAVGGGAAHPGPPSASSSSATTLSRTVSAEAHSEKAHSDSASVRSQRSNASELALAVLENIAEEGEGTDNGEDAAAEAASGAPSPAPGSRQASKQPTPFDSPRLAPSSPVKPGSPASSDGCRCDATERRFSVKGDWLEDDSRVQLRLRICEPCGTARTVEFEFDLAVDTATAVAAEMVSDLELTPDDASVIAVAIRNELARLSALPEMNPQASMSLAQAAHVFERSLTVNALEQAHSSNGNGAGLASCSSHQHGRFSDVEPAAEAAAATAAQQQPTAPAPPPVPLPSLSPTLASVPRPASFEVLSASSGSQRPSMEGTHGLPGLRRGGSSVSLASMSSASSIPASVASQPGSEPGHTYAAAAGGAGAPTLARASPPPRPASTPATITFPTMAPLASSPHATIEARPPPRPQSPPLPASTVVVDMPSPSQRVLRSTSMDAVHLLARTSSMPPGRDAAASPLGIGSGALSPAASGILSPATSLHEKRIPLNQLFANLEDLKAARTDTASPGLEAAMASVVSGASTPTLPPLPHPAGFGRTLPPSSSGSALEGAAGGSADLALLRPRSEACLTSLPLRSAPPQALSAPTGAGALAAAAALADSIAGSLASPTSASSNVSPRSTIISSAADALQRLDLQSSVPVAVVPAAGARAAWRGAHVLSAPPSKVPSRDGSLSPTRPGLANSGEGLANGKRPPIKDKEALRRQAADAMKAVEMRSLNLLEGGLGGLGKGNAKDSRGVSMASAKHGSMTGLAAAAAVPVPPPQVQPAPQAQPALQQQPAQQQQTPAHPQQQQQPTVAAGHPPLLPQHTNLQQQQAAQAAAQPPAPRPLQQQPNGVHPQPNGIAAGAASAPTAAAGTTQIPKPSVAVPPLPPPPGAPAVVPPHMTA